MPATLRIEVEVLEDTAVYAHALLTQASPGNVQRHSIMLDKVACSMTAMSGNGIDVFTVDLDNEVLDRFSTEQIIIRTFLG